MKRRKEKRRKEGRKEGMEKWENSDTKEKSVTLNNIKHYFIGGIYAFIVITLVYT